MNISKDLLRFEKKTKISFSDKKLLIQAFCHRSYINENPKLGLKNNERLEFLGDAVLELVVTEYIFLKYPKQSEGILTNWRAALVNTKILSKTARFLGFDKLVLLSKGQRQEKKEKALECVLAGTFEAFIGALYLDQGYKKCQNFIKTCLIKNLPRIIRDHLFEDAKSLLQKESQREEKVTPVYKLLKEWGPDNNKYFRMGIYLNDKLIAQGIGFSKQEAEEKAAKKALKIKKWKI